MNMDLSFSGIVGEIQGEEIKGADMIAKIANQKEKVDLEIKILEKELSQKKAESQQLVNGVEHILRHLKKETPLAVQRNVFIVLITDEGVSIQRNVI